LNFNQLVEHSQKQTSSKMSQHSKQQQIKRTKDCVIVKPIIYGNVAQHLGKKADETKTHKWTCYVRGLNANEDLSYIKKVVFELHESFTNPIREVLEGPWELSEEGWGEFEIKIRIHFQDTQEKPIVLSHLLCLYAKSTDPTFVANLKKAVVDERYEELIFVNPRPAFYNLLVSTFQQLTPDTDTTNEQPKRQKKNSYALSLQTLVENNAPRLDEKRDYDLLVRTYKALELKINDLNEQIGKKLEATSKLPL
jgi:hypothetical protein